MKIVGSMQQINSPTYRGFTAGSKPGPVDPVEKAAKPKLDTKNKSSFGNLTLETIQRRNINWSA